LPLQIVAVPANTAVEGRAFTVTLAVLEQLLLFVYVITLVPAATPVINPVVLVVALLVVPETHGVDPAAVPDPVSCVVEPIQTFKVPLIVGRALTVVAVEDVGDAAVQPLVV
jgi:hypothetical protein